MNGLPLGFFSAFLLFSVSVQAQSAEEMDKLVGLTSEELDGQHRARLQELTEVANPTGRQAFIIPTWQVWNLTAPSGIKRYAIFTGYPAITRPGQAFGSLSLFDENGRPLENWFFSSGWRLRVEMPAVAFDFTLNAFVVTVPSAPTINGRDIAKQIYALFDDKLFFVRMEDKQGAQIRNRHVHPNHTIGFDRPEKTMKTVEDCLKLLRSEVTVHRLAALTFLSGTHMAVTNSESEVFPQDIGVAHMAAKCHASPEGKALIAKYREAKHPWLKEAAELATTFQTDR